MAVPVKLFLNKSISQTLAQRNREATREAATAVMHDIGLDLNCDDIAEENGNLKKAAKVIHPNNLKMRLHLQGDEDSHSPTIVFEEDFTDEEGLSEVKKSKSTTEKKTRVRHKIGRWGDDSLKPRDLSTRKAYPVVNRKRTFQRNLKSMQDDSTTAADVSSEKTDNNSQDAHSSKNSDRVVTNESESAIVLSDECYLNSRDLSRNAYPVVNKKRPFQRKPKSKQDDSTSAADVSSLDGKSKRTKKDKIDNVGKDKELYKCPLCGKEFQREEQVNIHMRVHTGLKPYECMVCHKGFMQSRELRKHSRLHTGEKLSKCTVCEKVFITKSGLDRHMRSHTGEKPFTCFVCGKSYRENSVLQGHMRLHTGEKPFMCSLCGKSFHQRAHLYAHMRSHTGEKPHNCSVCGKSYRQRAEVKIHMRVHTGERPHKCTECDKAFKDSGTLKKHMKIHTGEKPWKCSICGDLFRESGALYKHMRGHTGEKPYKCTECGKAFREKDVLKRHMRIHTGEKPCRCTVCYKAFRESGALYRHMRIHANKDSTCSQESSFKKSPTSPALLSEPQNCSPTTVGTE